MFTPREAAKNLIDKYGEGEAESWAHHFATSNWDDGNHFSHSYWERVKVELSKLRKGGLDHE